MDNENILLVEDWGQPFQADETDKHIHIITESSDSTLPAGTYISGVFLQAEKKNGNGRIYPKSVLEKAVNEYVRTQVNTKQALGELNHPGRSNPDPVAAAVIIEKLEFQGNDVIGRARVLDTPNGKIVKSLIEGGWIPGVSSRGLGRLKNVNGINEVQEGFILTVGIDVVWGPSCGDAFVSSHTVTENLQTHNQEPLVERKLNNSTLTSAISRLKMLL